METVAPFKEVIDEIKEAGGEIFKLCFQCGLCDVVCPWNKVRTFSMRKLIREAAFGLSEVEGEDIWRCTTCGNCPSQCPRGVEQIEVGVAIRRIASAYDVFPASVQPVRGATLIGNGPEVMTRISMVGDDLALDTGVGTCGKDGQSVPVGVGQPTLKIDQLTVGGTAA